MIENTLHLREIENKDWANVVIPQMSLVYIHLNFT